jgi:hypothetical protein
MQNQVQMQTQMQTFKRMKLPSPLFATKALERASKRRRTVPVEVQELSTSFSSFDQMLQDISPPQEEAFPAITWEFDDDSASCTSHESKGPSFVSTTEHISSAGSKRSRSGLVRCKSFTFDLAGL